MTRLAFRCSIFAVVAATFFACSDDRDGFVQPGPPSLGGDGGDANTTQSCNGLKCSRDLHSVVDGCTGNVVQTCPPDQGCGSEKCVAPCDAAAQSLGSIGCSFYTTPPDTLRTLDSSCFAAFVANTWSTPVNVTATYGADALDISKSVYRAIPSTTDDYTNITYQRIDGPIPPGEVGIVFLEQGDPVPGGVFGGDDNPIACPTDVTVALHANAAKDHETTIYNAFHLATDVPVSAYSIFPYGGAKSFVTAGTLLLPTSSWGTNYMMLDGYPGAFNKGLPFVQIVSQDDDTVVSIKPKTDIIGGSGVNPAAENVVTTYTLQKGQVLEIVQGQSLDGSPLQSNKPVAIFGGTQCSDLPLAVDACDALHQQIPPISEWGSSYSAVPYTTRRVPLAGQSPLPEAVIWAIGAARDGTVLTYDPEPSGSNGTDMGSPGDGPPDGIPRTLNGGQVVWLYSDHPFRVRSQGPDYPIYVANYMTGALVYYTDGDPDFTNTVADTQFLDDYVFFVDHTYKTSTLTLVRQKDQQGFHDVTLDCAGVVGGWTPLGGDGTTEYAYLDITRDGKPSGKCLSGRHQATSDGPFALYVYGIDSFVSYGFPAGAGTRPLSPYQIVVK